MKDLQLLGFLISTLSIMFFMGIFFTMKKNTEKYDKGEMDLEEFKTNKKGFIKSSIFSILLVSLGGLLVLLGF